MRWTSKSFDHLVCSLPGREMGVGRGTSSKVQQDMLYRQVVSAHSGGHPEIIHACTAVTTCQK